MAGDEKEMGPRFVPITSEVAIIASAFNEKVYKDPELYKIAFESGRLITDKERMHYVPREGEDEALETINELIISKHIRYLEIDPQHDDLFYDDPKQKDLLSRFQTAQGKHHETLYREVTAARIGFVISQVVEYKDKRRTREKPVVKRAG
jgi:hypothetical protein